MAPSWTVETTFEANGKVAVAVVVAIVAPGVMVQAAVADGTTPGIIAIAEVEEMSVLSEAIRVVATIHVVSMLHVVSTIHVVATTPMLAIRAVASGTGEELPCVDAKIDASPLQAATYG